VRHTEEVYGAEKEVEGAAPAEKHS